MTAPRLPHDEEDLMRYWQDNPVSLPNPADYARHIADEVKRFDRRIFWRNAREYAACAILLFWTRGGVMEGRPGAIVMAAAALIIAGYLWWNHRRRRPIDAGADARTYQAAMLKRYDDQIALFGLARYWYWLPLYIPVIVITVMRWKSGPGFAAITFGTATALFVLLWWLNDRFAIRPLKAARARVAALLDDAG
jgi:hypothetical protein